MFQPLQMALALLCRSVQCFFLQMQNLDRAHEAQEDGLEGRERASGSSSRPTLASFFGRLCDWKDVRGGPLDQWVRQLRDGYSVLSSNHHEMTHEGVWAEEPLPDNQQGPGKPDADETEKDYLQTYSAGYVMVHHCRQRQELFHPGVVGFPIDPHKLRNERLTGCRCSTGILAPVDAMMTIEDNWRAVGPHKLVAGVSWWSGFTVFVLQGAALPWETPPRIEEGDDEEETMDPDPELSDFSISETTATNSSPRSRSRSPRRPVRR